MLLKTPIETQRLILRPESMDDFDAVYTMHRDPEVMRFVAERHPLVWSREEALAVHRRIVEGQANRDYGNLSAVLKETGRYIGWCGLNPHPQLDGIELGYRYVRRAWGNGYATEAARALVAAGFEQLGLPRVVAWVQRHNAASIRVLEKVGMTYIRDEFHEKHNDHVCVYAIENPALAD